MKPRHQRAALIVGGVAAIAAAAYFVLNAFQENIQLFLSPTEVVQGSVPKNRTFRVGGLVKTGSIQRDSMTVNFVITDTSKDLRATYTGILPDLFREGKGVVALGKMSADGQTFVATEVLAKHDENYMPPEAKEAIDKARQAAKTVK